MLIIFVKSVLVMNSCHHILNKLNSQDKDFLAHPSYAFGMHKGGSTMLAKFFNMYANKLGLKNISISNELFRNGIGDAEYTRDEGLLPVFNENVLFHGFRYIPLFMLKNKSLFVNSPAIVLVRDPRDCVVSAYYSFLKSHVVQADLESDSAKQIASERDQYSNVGIDEYAIDSIGRFIYELNGYAYFFHENILVFRYEDVIFDKVVFFEKVISHLGLNFDRDIFDICLNAVDIVPQKEDATSHIRSVTPGDHRRKLQVETINIINDRYNKELSLYGYV